MSSLRVADQENEDNTTTTRGAAVLISDGGHNRENSPLKPPSFYLFVISLTVGFGSNQKPIDLALLQTLVLLSEDRIILSIKDDLFITFPLKIPPVSMFGEKPWLEWKTESAKTPIDLAEKEAIRTIRRHRE